MSALVIILLGTVLIQGSSLILGNESSRLPLQARLSLSAELREASFTIITITLSAVFGFSITHYILMPLQLNYLRTPALVFITACIIIAARSFIDVAEHSPQHRVLVLLTNQCALLGVALFSAFLSNSLPESFAYGFGASLALALLSAAFRALMERINTSAIPFVFRGIPLSLISAGLMALALMGFAGIIRN